MNDFFGKIKKPFRIALFFLFLLLLSGLPASGKSGTYLFANDTPWQGVPYETIYGEYYLPASFFRSFPQTEVKSDTRIGTLLIDRGEYGSISFDFDSETGYTPKDGFFACKTYLLRGGERFLPSSVVCPALSLTLEISPEKAAVRVGDGSEKRTIEDLIASPMGEDDPVDTLPPVVAPVQSGVLPVCIVIDSEELSFLQILSETGVRAVFLTEDGAAEGRGDFLFSVFCCGGWVAFSFDAPEPEEAVNAMRRNNDLLCRLTNTRTRLLSFPTEGRDYASDFRSLYSMGYLLCPQGLNASSFGSADAILQRIGETEGGVIRFSSGTEDLLRRLIAEVTERSDRYVFSPLTPAVCALGTDAS